MRSEAGNESAPAGMGPARGARVQTKGGGLHADATTPGDIGKVAALPASMRDARRWLLWRYEPSADPQKKPRKVPYYASGARRSGQLDSEWDRRLMATFADALRTFEAGGFSGLGFALGPDGSGRYWQGIDLDGLLDRPELHAIALALPGYTETSPSGNGVHAIGYGGRFDSLGSNATGIEAYAGGRFFTVTADNAGTHPPVCLAEFVAQRLTPIHKGSGKPSPSTPASVHAHSAAVLPWRAPDIDELRSALAAIPAYDRDVWQRMGHALKTLGDDGRALFMEWSATSGKFDPDADARTWESFTPSRTDWRAVFAEAQRCGWQNPKSRAAVLGLHSRGKPAESAASGTDSDAAPEPLRRPTPAPEPYPVADLGLVLGDACKSIQRVIQAPDAVCAASLLAAASLAAQALANVEIDGRIVPLSLWFLTVAESGERKSAIDSEALRAAREHEKALIRDYDSAFAGHEAEVEEWTARKEAAKAKARKSNGEGLARSLRDLGPQPVPPLRPNLIAADFTAEGLSKLLANGLPSIGAFTDEAALVFGGHGMTKETTARTAGTLCKLWDSGTLDRIRAADGAVKLYGQRLALHLMAQPVIAERALSDDVLAGQGFLARCLLSWPRPTAGTRAYVSESLRDDPAMIRCAAMLAALHQRPLPLAEGQRNELVPRALRLEDSAFQAWRRFHDAIEAAMAPDGRFAIVKPWASKTPEQALRIAGVLTLTERPDAGGIDAATIERAAELALWHLNEAARLAGTTAELPPVILDAEALLEWAHATGRALLNSNEALRMGPNRVRERGRFMQAMGALEGAGWAVRIDGGMEIDGAHRRHVWRIVPANADR